MRDMSAAEQAPSRAPYIAGRTLPEVVRDGQRSFRERPVSRLRRAAHWTKRHAGRLLLASATITGGIASPPGQDAMKAGADFLNSVGQTTQQDRNEIGTGGQTKEQRIEINKEIVIETTAKNGDSQRIHRIQRVLDGNLIIEFPSDDPKFVFLKDPYVGETPNDYNGIPGAKIKTVNGVDFNSSKNRITVERALLGMDRLTGALHAIVLIEADGLDGPQVVNAPIGNSGTSVAYFSGSGEILTVKEATSEMISAEQGTSTRLFDVEDVNITTVEPKPPPK